MYVIDHMHQGSEYFQHGKYRLRIQQMLAGKKGCGVHDKDSRDDFPRLQDCCETLRQEKPLPDSPEKEELQSSQEFFCWLNGPMDGRLPRRMNHLYRECKENVDR